MIHTPRKRFGQHFLCDQVVIQRIVEVLAPKADEHLIEIGPGQGAITLPILKRVKHLEVIELDHDLIPELKRRTQHQGELVIYSEDALAFDFAKVQIGNERLRIFGNLPYNISTPLIFHLLEYRHLIADMLFMLQKEVALRLVASAGTEHYSRLSVMVQYHCQVEKLFDVSPRAFFPPPQVQSSLVHLTPYRESPYLAQDYALFESIVRHAFSMRRKTLRNSLKGIVDDTLWAHIAIHSDLRPEELSVKDFVDISNACSTEIK